MPDVGFQYKQCLLAPFVLICEGSGILQGARVNAEGRGLPSFQLALLPRVKARASPSARMLPLVPGQVPLTFVPPLTSSKKPSLISFPQLPTTLPGGMLSFNRLNVIKLKKCYQSKCYHLTVPHLTDEAAEALVQLLWGLVYKHLGSLRMDES